MFDKLFFASILALTSTTALAGVETPARKAPTPSTTTGCQLTQQATTQVFQIERKSKRQTADVETKLIIQSNGAWVLTSTKGGKALDTVTEKALADITAITNTLVKP